MDFQRITQPHPDLNTIRVWYETAFPAHERRTFDGLLELLPCPDMHLCALVADAKWVGFIIYWQWPDVSTLFIEHIAIDPQQRNKQFGQQVIQQILQLDFTHFLLEAECPTDAISERRIGFYERQGFSLNLFAYAQPPYQRGKPDIPMKLMSIPALEQQKEFDEFSKLIKERVYERFY